MYTERYIGERVQERRLKLGLTQKELAAKINEGIGLDDSPHTQISEWENGRKIPRTEALLRLCNALDCDIDYLLGEIDVPHRSTYDVMEQTGLDQEAVECLQNIRFYEHGDLGVIKGGLVAPTLAILSELIKSDGFLPMTNELALYLLCNVLPKSKPNELVEISVDEREKFDKWISGIGYEIYPSKDVAEMHLQTAADKMKDIFRNVLSEGIEISNSEA